jgi:predicted NBD/HSP70 family sugar kinase
MKKLVFDIGATNTKFAVMTAQGEIHLKESFPTNYESAQAYFDSIAAIAARFLGEVDEIAISTNGRMHPDGDTYRAYTMKFLVDKNLKQEIEARTGLPTAVLNDGFSAALGEWWKGSGQGYNNLLVIVLGSGMGGGLILNGELYQGHRRNAAMIFGMLSAYGHGRYELSGMATSFQLLLYRLAMMRQIPIREMTGKRFFEFVADGDPGALELLDAYCESIAGIVFNAVRLLDLDCAVVTGGLSEQPALMAGIRSKLLAIPAQFQSGPAAGFMDMVAMDERDFQIDLKQGSLGIDANVYGALYHLLNQKA